MQKILNTKNSLKKNVSECWGFEDTVHFPLALCGHFLDGFLLERDVSFSEVVFV